MTRSSAGQGQGLGEEAMSQIARREFVTLIAAAAVPSLVWPLAAQAQQPGKLPTIGFLGASTPSGWAQWTTAFLQRLRQLGWTEGRTVAIEYRWADGHSERYADIAAELVQLNVDVIVTVGSAVLAAKQVTSTIPIVFAIAVDPLATGMVASLARPGGNATGISVQSTELAGKRLEILREALPDLSRLAIIGDVDYAGSVLEISQLPNSASMLKCSK
jgi:putative ABC transport system substrate-binding protein